MSEKPSLQIVQAYASDGFVDFDTNRQSSVLASISDVENHLALTGKYHDGLIEVIEGIYEWQGDEYIKVDTLNVMLAIEKEKKLAS
jgi:hypothetical protein